MAYGIELLGQRVQLHPATDLWMQGERYGEVTGTTRTKNLRVRLDKSGRTVAVHPDNVIPLRDVQISAAVLRALRSVSACCLDNEDEVERVHAAVMAELSLVGIRDSRRPDGAK